MITPHNLARWIMVCVLALCGAGCGWQLQGTLHIPAQLLPLHVEFKDEYSPFTLALRQRLKASGVALVENAGAANTVLTITDDQPGRRVASVSAINQPTEYEIFYGAAFSLVRKQGDQPALQRALRESQVISYSPELELAKQREQRGIYDSMAASMADQVVRQLSTALRVKNADGAAP